MSPSIVFQGTSNMHPTPKISSSKDGQLHGRRIADGPSADAAHKNI